ncbi:MAG TPA: hypothetical protein VEI96_13115 [Thermodesulfovibrionales bacterium]|nr:hypothetical protein [Thermodesulfovibrionales bacterium]
MVKNSGRTVDAKGTGHEIPAESLALQPLQQCPNKKEDCPYRAVSASFKINANNHVDELRLAYYQKNAVISKKIAFIGYVRRCPSVSSKAAAD